MTGGIRSQFEKWPNFSGLDNADGIPDRGRGGAVIARYVSMKRQCALILRKRASVEGGGPGGGVLSSTVLYELRIW